MKKNDILFITLLVLTAGFLFIFFNYGREHGNSAFITVDGINYGSYSLYDNQQITVYADQKKSSYNNVVIEDGSVFVTDASCPDHICVHHKAIMKIGETIVCLPNKTVIGIQGEKSETPDGVTR